MADINVDVNLPNPINVDITSPTQSLSTNIFVPGPQGPIGPIGPQGPIGIVNTGELDVRYVGVTGNQNISGNKNFYSRPNVNGTGILLSGEATKLPDTIVYTTGDQSISGIKTFSDNIQISGTGIFNGLNLLKANTALISGVTLIITGSAVKIYNLPTNTLNLPSGSLWVDTSAGNVLKIVI
jgi:hypothetical protein